MVADTTAPTTQAVVDQTWGGSIKRFEIDTQNQDKDWLILLSSNLQALKTAFDEETRQSIHVSFTASYPPLQEGEPIRQDRVTNKDIYTEFSVLTRAQHFYDGQFQNGVLFPTDLLSYIDTAIHYLRERFPDERLEVEGYHHALDIAAIPDLDGYYSEEEILTKKKTLVKKVLGHLVKFCREKLEGGNAEEGELTDVLEKFIEEVKENPLKAWDQEIGTVGNAKGVQALAQFFTQAPASVKELTILGVQVSVLELKKVFDQFQRSIKEEVVEKSSYEYEGKTLQASQLLSTQQIESIEKEAFNFRVLDDSGDILDQALGDPARMSTGGEDSRLIREFLHFYGDEESQDQVVKILRGKLQKKAAAAAADTETTPDDSGGEAGDIQPEESVQEVTQLIAEEDVVDDLVKALAVKVFEAYGFAEQLEGRNNRLLVEQFIREDLERRISMLFGASIVTFIEESPKEEFFNEQENAFISNPAYFRWQKDTVTEFSATVINSITEGVNPSVFSTELIATARGLIGETPETTPSASTSPGTVKVTTSSVPQNLATLLAEYRAGYPEIFTSNWDSLSWEQRREYFTKVARQATILTDTVTLSALGSYGLQDVDLKVFQLNPELRRYLHEEIKTAFLSLSAEEWLTIQESTAVPLSIYRKVLGRVLPTVTQEGSTFDNHLRAFLFARVIAQSSGESVEEVLQRFGLRGEIDPSLFDEELRQLYNSLTAQTSEQTSQYLETLSTHALAEQYIQHKNGEIISFLSANVSTQARTFSLLYLDKRRGDIVKKMRALGVGLDADGHLAITEALVTVLGAESLAFVDVATRNQLSEILGISLGNLSDEDLLQLREYLRSYLQTNLDRRLALLGKESVAFLPFTAQEFARGESAITRANLRAFGRAHQKYGDTFTYASQLTETEVAGMDVEQTQATAVSQLKHQLFLQTFSLKEGQTADLLKYGMSEEDALYFNDPQIWANVSLAQLSNYQAQLAGVDAVLPEAQERGRLGKLAQRFGLERKVGKAVFNQAATAALNTAVPGYSAFYKAGEAIFGKKNMQRIQMAFVYGGASAGIGTAITIATSSVAQAGFAVGSVVGSVVPGLGTVAGGVSGAWGALALKGLTGSNASLGAGAAGSGTGAGSASAAAGGGLLSNVGTLSVAAGTTAIATCAVVTTLVIHGSFVHELDITPQAGETSKYVEITKTASPNKIENNSPTSITYTITITPRESYVITPVRVRDTFSFIGGDEAVEPAAITSPLDGALAAPLDAPISAPVTLTYTIPNVSGTDVLVNNTFNLEFEVNEPSGELVADDLTAIGSLIIGNPQIGCFEFAPGGVDFKGMITKEWTPEEKNEIQTAFSRRAGNSGKFVTMLCEDGLITLNRLEGTQYGGYAPASEGGRQIGIYDKGIMYSVESTEYTLIHELGHVIDYRNPGLRTGGDGFNSVWGGSCYTYPEACVDSEAFAEAVALFVIGPTYSFSGFSGLFPFQANYPAEYNWMLDNVFGAPVN